MSVAIPVPTAVRGAELLELGGNPVGGKARGELGGSRRADLEHAIEQGECLIGAAPREADPGGIGSGASPQPERRPEAHPPGNPGPHAEPCDHPPDGTMVEIPARVAQADVTTNATDPPVSPRTHHAGGVGLKALAVGVTGAIVPTAQERSEHSANAAGAVGEPLATDD